MRYTGTKIIEEASQRFVATFSSLSSLAEMKKLIYLCLCIGLLGCKSAKKTELQSPLNSSMAQIAGIFNDPANLPILIVAPFQDGLIDTLLAKGHRLQLVMPLEMHEAHKQKFNAPEEQLTFIALNKGTFEPQGMVRDIITFADLFEKPSRPKFYEEWIENCYQRLPKGQSLYVIMYTEEAKSLGLKPSTIELDQLYTIGVNRFNGKVEDNRDITGIRLLKFTK